MNTGRFLVIAGALVALCGCATHQQYDWGTYERSLYVYYKDPATAARFSQALQATINGAEQEKRPVAPGIYAEYGYLLLKQGKPREAIASFRQEESHWPESKLFMDQMIKAASISGDRAKGN